MNRTTRHGLTLPELVIGTAMLGIIGMATVSFTLAMSAGWDNSNTQFKLENASKRSSDRVESVLANMLYVAQSKTSSAGSANAYVFFWNRDAGLVAADGKAQLGEMALMEYDPSARTIWLYTPRTTNLTAGETSTLTSDTWGDTTSPAIIPYFKSLSSVERTPVVGGSSSGVAVVSGNFSYFVPTGAKPMTTYTLEIQSATQQATTSGTVPMRAGRKPRNF